MKKFSFISFPPPPVCRFGAHEEAATAVLGAPGHRVDGRRRKRGPALWSAGVLVALLTPGCKLP